MTVGPRFGAVRFRRAGMRPRTAWRGGPGARPTPPELRFGPRVQRLPESGGTMGGMALPQVVPVETPEIEEVPADDRLWVTIVWDDPVNLMSYVTWVFQKLFGYSRDKAEKLMLDVHHKGKAVVSIGTRERMEMDASQLHGYGLWATVDRA